MKLFIWDDVLTDYTPGIMFAIAPNVEDARKQLRVVVGRQEAAIAQTPKVYRVDHRVCRAVHGGG